jgi:hypothetical protein
MSRLKASSDHQNLLLLYGDVTSHLEDLLKPLPDPPNLRDISAVRRSLEVCLRFRLIISADEFESLIDRLSDGLRHDITKMRSHLARQATVSNAVLLAERQRRIAAVRSSIAQLQKENDQLQMPITTMTSRLRELHDQLRARQASVEQAERSLADFRRDSSAVLAREREQADGLHQAIASLASDIKMLEIRKVREIIQLAKSQATLPARPDRRIRAPSNLPRRPRILIRKSFEPPTVRQYEEPRVIPIRVGPIWESDGDDSSWNKRESPDSDFDSLIGTPVATEDPRPGSPIEEELFLRTRAEIVQRALDQLSDDSDDDGLDRIGIDHVAAVRPSLSTITILRASPLAADARAGDGPIECDAETADDADSSHNAIKAPEEDRSNRSSRRAIDDGADASELHYYDQASHSSLDSITDIDETSRSSFCADNGSFDPSEVRDRPSPILMDNRDCRPGESDASENPIDDRADGNSDCSSRGTTADQRDSAPVDDPTEELVDGGVVPSEEGDGHRPGVSDLTSEDSGGRASSPLLDGRVEDGAAQNSIVGDPVPSGGTGSARSSHTPTIRCVVPSQAERHSENLLEDPVDSSVIQSDQASSNRPPEPGDLRLLPSDERANDRPAALFASRDEDQIEGEPICSDDQEDPPSVDRDADGGDDPPADLGHPAEGEDGSGGTVPGSARSARLPFTIQHSVVVVSRSPHQLHRI